MGAQTGRHKIIDCDILTVRGQMNLAGASGVAKTAKVALAAVDTAGGIFAWPNPEVGPIIVTDTTLDVTTVSSAACTVSVGAAANATTLSAGLISGQDVRTATGQFTSTASQKVAAGGFVTGSKASGASAGLAGSAYITYILA